MMNWSRKTQLILAAVPVGLLLLAFLVFPGNGSRTVTAHFDRAVAVYPGTDLRVMGVRVGEVTSVVPEGDSVRVEMIYDTEYKLPADAGAAVVTPSLVADRYVQVFPAYSSGPEMADGADIPLDRTKTPIELDRMFKSLDDLAVTLGPKAGSTKGALSNLLAAGAKALDGNGELGSETIRSLSAAAEVFADNRGPLFQNVRALAGITDTLAANDATVEAFVESLAGVSGQLAGERDELTQVLASLSQVLGSVQGFVKENRVTLGKDIELLGSLLGRIDNQKDSLALVIQKAPLAMGNLAIAYEPTTGTFGSRVQVGPGLQFRPDNFICQSLIVIGSPELVCDVLTSLLEPLLTAGSGDTPAAPESSSSSPVPDVTGPSAPDLNLPGSVGDLPVLPDLLELLGGGRR